MSRPAIGFGAAVALVVLLYAFAWWTGERGIDFGDHWDEPRALATADEALERVQVLPGQYRYPSLGFDLIIVALTPDLVRTVPWSRLTAVDKQAVTSAVAALKARVHSKAFRLGLRTLFMALTLATGVWAFCIVASLAASPWEAALAAALTLLSWEIAYHARWVAPDGLAMQFGTLTVLCLVRSLRPGSSERWLDAAAVAAGLTCASKYPGGIMLIAVLARVLAGSREADPASCVRRRLVRSVAWFSGTMVVTTPGMLVDPLRFMRDVAWEVGHYASRGHFGYTTSGIGDHLRLETTYLVTVVLSPYPTIAIAGAAAVVLGVVALSRRSRIAAAVVFGAPVALTLYLGLQKVMIVRNLLLVVPAMAIGAALGIGEANRIARRFGPFARFLVPAVSIVALALNGAWLWRASESITGRLNRDERGALVRFIDAHPADAFHFSPSAARLLAGGRIVHARLAAGGPGAREWLVFCSSEVPLTAWPANRAHYTLLPTGPFEVNWNYYPSWAGIDRVVMLPVSEVLDSGLRDVFPAAGGRASR